MTTIFLQPTDEEEIANIISSLNSSKASGQNSIPYRILFLLRTKISKQLADLFNLSLMNGVFPSALNSALCFSFYNYNNYRPISLLLNIERYLKNLCIKDCIPYSITITLYTVWI